MEQSPSISRRRFAALSAATAGALMVPSGESRADGHAEEDGLGGTVDEHTTDLYGFLLERVETDYALPTLIRFENESGFDALDDLDVPYRTHTDETTAAHAELVPADAKTVAEADPTDTLEYSPGANPFWKLEAYDDRVFPEPQDSVSHIAYDEARAGLEHLQGEHPDRLNVVDIGDGHGFENVYDGSHEPRSLRALELTDGVDTSFEDREKLVFTMSVHGDERAGTEACLRFVEGILDGDHPDIESLLSEFVLVFVAANPDGWVVEERVYEDPVSPPDFIRANGAFHDLNRQQPVTGWINPRHLPAEPEGRRPDNGTDDVPEKVAEEVPETLSLVEHLRDYETVEYVVDFHGMYGHSNAVLGLTTGGGSLEAQVEQDLLFRTVGEQLEASVGPLTDWEDTFEAATEDTDEQYGCRSEFLCQVPDELFGYGTPGDAIGYSASGAIDGWAGMPEEEGGLGATSVTTEIVHSNSVRMDMENRFMPDMTEFHVAAYQAVCRATIQFAADTIEATVETDERTTAFVASETLTRRAEELPHFGAGGSGNADGTSTLRSGTAGLPGRFGTGSGPQGTEIRTDRTTFTADEPTSEQTIAVSGAVHTLDIEVHPETTARTTLRDPAGNANPNRELAARARQPHTGGSRYTVTHPRPGEWTVEVRTAGDDVVEIATTSLETRQDAPDPGETLGYQQRDYDVSPLAAFDSLGDTTFAPQSVEEVRDGALLQDDGLAYDNLVITHDEGIDEAYLDALRTYVERGGNLVLTDAGLTVASELDVEPLGSDLSVHREELFFANYGTQEERDTSHPLFADIREYAEESWITQTVPWQHQLLGYAPEEVPAYEVENGGLWDAGTVAVETEDGSARLATVPTIEDRVGIHLLGTLLPPATQENLHPFGLADHGLTLLGYQVLCNALGYEITAARNGEQVRTFGSTVDVTLPEVAETPEETDSGTDGNTDSGTDGNTDSGTEASTDTGNEGDANSTAGTAGTEGDPDGTGTAEGADDESTSADDDGAGFGMLTGLSSLGGVGYLLGRRLADSEESESASD